MSMKADEVEKIAHLARIAIDQQDVPQYAENLSKILDFVEQLSQADTENVAPMAHPLDMHQRLRDDVVSEENQREQFQSIAPSVDAGLYLVPKVIE